jgi:hypothetical protein
MSRIVDVNGRRVKRKTTDAPFPARLFEMLAALSDTLSQQGIELRCVRCGTPVQGNNHPFDAIYYLDCQCARRTFDRTKQLQSVQLHATPAGTKVQ